ncbi:ATP synthase F1 subunit epsilon [Methyloceanibacter stevinii]|uniref:ATP synthase epsilon chain n=1 Tax=Methyloceanibacter stevinii TaxID=1774970 RepID=A0A1E3VJC6_9HYPH|nr:F0F1 ATP synthase subunit epsilon [Methyloceanibacter stevinii]ODR93614.1 ATP synthase F1 subunit epsilon [Methyloceanibacter stevinii]
MPDPFKFELVSPEKLVFSGDVEQVLVPGAEGDMTILAKHAPLITTLRPGLLEIDFPDGKRQRFFARGGFAEVIPAGLTVLAERAIDLDELDPAQLSQDIADAEEDVADLSGEAKDKAQMTLEHLRQVQSALGA